MFPLALRSFAVKLCRSEPWKSLAGKAYDWATSSASESFASHPSVRVVAVRGGAAFRRVPAVSDIDFILGVSTESIADVLEVRKIYLQQKRLLPVMGELLVLDPFRWELAHRYRPHVYLLLRERVYINGDEDFLANHPYASPSNEVLFSSGLHHFARALTFLSDGKTDPFIAASFEREISKAIAYASDKPIEVLRNETPQALLERAFLLLDQRAKREVSGNHRFANAPVNLCTAFPKVSSSPSTLFLSPAMYEYSLQWGLWNHPLENLSFLENSIRSDRDWMERFHVENLKTIRTLCRSHYCQLLGQLACSSLAEIRKNIRTLALEAMALRTHLLIDDEQTLSAEAKPLMPYTAALMEDVYSESLTQLGRKLPSALFEIREILTA
jgi:hypothetical protein